MQNRKRFRSCVILACGFPRFVRWGQVILNGLWALGAAWPRTRTSNPVSRLFRPWFEHRRARAAFGLCLLATIAVTGVLGTPIIAAGDRSSQQEIGAELTIVPAPQAVVVSTDRTFRMPVFPVDISQSFQTSHPGIDLR